MVKYGKYARKLLFKIFYFSGGGYLRDIDPEIAKDYMKSCWNMEGGLDSENEFVRKWIL